MRGGLNRKARAAHRAAGTFRPARHRGEPLDVEAGKIPPPPSWLRETERKVWLELTPQVEALGVYSSSDFSAFTLLVHSLALTRQGDGLPPSARARLLQSASAQLASFGCVPAARERVPRAKRETAEQREQRAEFEDL